MKKKYCDTCRFWDTPDAKCRKLRIRAETIYLHRKNEGGYNPVTSSDFCCCYWEKITPKEEPPVWKVEVAINGNTNIYKNGELWKTWSAYLHTGDATQSFCRYLERCLEDASKEKGSP